MGTHDKLIERVIAAGEELEWYGPQTQIAIEELSNVLGVDLPVSFRAFLAEYGGGGVVGEWISGIVDGDPVNPVMGSVFGDTMRCRGRHNLPGGLVVVFSQDDDEVLWCLDADARNSAGECPVVAFDITGHEPQRPISPSFSVFIQEYLTLRAGI
jgi:hypothetical protein